MKKLVGALACISIIASSVICSWAADKEKGEPDVFVDESKIIFEDQNAVIADGITLVPARGVFSAMGCTVKWDGETRTVRVTSSTGVRYVVITIDSDVMKICTYKDIMNRVDVDYKLEVPAQIINDRTMIPLRAVSEAFGAEVKWNEKKYAVEITSGADILTEDAVPDATPEPVTTQKPVYDEDGNQIGTETVTEDSRTSMKLSTDKTGALKAGEEFYVYIDVDNFPECDYLNAIVAELDFDKNRFEYIPESCVMLGDEGQINTNAELVENPDLENGARAILVTIVPEDAKTSGGHAARMTFKSINGESGTIALNNDYRPITEYNSYVMFYNGKNTTHPDMEVKGKKLALYTSPLIIGDIR